VRTFRLPNRLTSRLEVSDRFHLKPLLRSVTFLQAAFVLALAQTDRSATGRIQGAQKVRMRQYARQIDQALALRREDIPSQGTVAAILRYPV
jgi:hypothetical protein